MDFSIVNPRQTILVTARAEVSLMGKKSIKDNIITLDWHTPVSFQPFLYAIAVGKKRFTVGLLKKSKVFCVNFMDIINKKEVLFCGTNSGEHINKFAKSGLTKEECEKIDCPKIGQAIGFLECELISEIEAGDHILFIGKVLNSQSKTGKNIFHIGENEFGYITKTI